MKNYRLLVVAVTCALGLLLGCSKSGVDTRPVEKSFASAEPSLKSSADRAVAAVKAADYSTALAELQKLSLQAKLSPEQQQAIKDVLAQVQQKVTEQVEKTTKEAGKALQDMGKSLGK